MFNACARKEEPDTLAVPNALEQARARAASQQIQQEPVSSGRAPSNTYSSPYIK